MIRESEIDSAQILWIHFYDSLSIVCCLERSSDDLSFESAAYVMGTRISVWIIPDP